MSAEYPTESSTARELLPERLSLTGLIESHAAYDEFVEDLRRLRKRLEE